MTARWTWVQTDNVDLKGKKSQPRVSAAPAARPPRLARLLRTIEGLHVHSPWAYEILAIRASLTLLCSPWRMLHSSLSSSFGGDLKQISIRPIRWAQGGEVASAFAQLLHKLVAEGPTDAHSAFSPEAFYRTLCKHCTLVAEQPGVQQDAQEVMAFLLDAIHEDLNRNRGQRSECKAPQSFHSEDSCCEEHLAAQAWCLHLQQHRSVVIDLCQGQLRSQVQCCECGCASITFDPFLFLSLPMPSHVSRGRRVHIEEAIKAFCVEEKLAGDDSWGCPRCDRRVSASKRLSLWKLPLLLFVHLKRFGFEARTWGIPTWKIEGEVGLPSERLDLQDFVPKMSTDLQYDLFAAVDHVGSSPFSGHYTASCRRADGWWRFDDSRTEYLGRAGCEATDRKVIGSWNYLLMFQRRDGPADPEKVPEQSHRHPELWPHVLPDGTREWSFLKSSTSGHRT